ncbi:MAG: hypothetical protein H0W85_10285 [Methylotenera sp.]|nr:hypothetical protein [Methylotenera sp.]
MEIIPVIDLMHGQVVHAKQGQRQNYQPIQSLLCASSAPLDVLNALLELYPFTTIYIADIDAIQGLGTHFELINIIASQFPYIDFWVDNGHQAKVVSQLAMQNIHLVIGTENMNDISTYLAIRSVTSNCHVLSLDFKNGHALGVLDLHCDSQYWPAEVICMNLNQVGSGLGADMKMLNNLSRLNSKRTTPSRLFAAGGIRNIDDCLKLKTMGIAGVLIASALHSQTIGTGDIEMVHGEISSAPY